MRANDWEARNYSPTIQSPTKLGAIGGYIYWQQIGCDSGTCAITSKPLNSTLYGAMMGALLLGMFKKEEKTKTANQ